MKVKELIKQLEKLNPEIDVVQSVYDPFNHQFRFIYADTARSEYISLEDWEKDREFAYIYSGDYLE